MIDMNKPGGRGRCHYCGEFHNNVSYHSAHECRKRPTIPAKSVSGTTPTKDVHTEHCCIIHGCKYWDDNCTVTTKQKKQSFRCEDCGNLTDTERMEWLVKHPNECYDLASKYATDRLDFRKAIDAEILKVI